MDWDDRGLLIREFSEKHGVRSFGISGKRTFESVSSNSRAGLFGRLVELNCAM